MENVLHGLDDEQRAVVMHRDGPAIVIAGPGAGKTRTLTARIGSLLAEGVSPEAIMALTFTRSAAKDMVRRASAIDSRAQYATAGTFHAVGSKIIQANARILLPEGLDKPFTILTEEDVEAMIRKRIDLVKGKDKNWPRAGTVGKIISYADNAQIPIADVIAAKYPDYQDHAEAIESIAAAYAEEKLDKAMLSYDDCLLYWTALLEDEVVGPELRSRWPYVLIDEAQDTNALQAALINGLAGPNGNVMIVADAAQSIYGFRGAKPGVVRDFHHAYPQAQVYTISSNYRSTPEIVALADAIDKQIDTGFPRTLRSASGRSGSRPAIVDVHDAAAEAKAIVAAILADKEDGGEVSNHAVLVRATAGARRIEAEFLSAKIPFVVRGGTRIDKAAHIHDLLSVARIVRNPQHEPAWARMLLRFPKIGDTAAAAILPNIMRSDDLGEITPYLRQESEARRTNLHLLADAIEDCMRPGDPAERLDRVVRIMTPVWENVKEWKDDWKNRARDLEAIVMIAQEHPDLDTFLTAITLDGSLDREDIGSAQKADEDPVTISTIHGAKGMEWDHVHISAFVQGGMPSLFANEPDAREEEMRLLFVAATRARKTLQFYRPRMNGSNNFTMASDFEYILTPHVDQRQHVQKTVQGDARVETTRRIDMRSRILGRK